MKRAVLLVVWLCMVTVSGNYPVYGVSAYPYPTEVIQPDGTKLIIISRGDEHLKWAESADGYSLLRNSQGIFEYAKMDSMQEMVLSGIKARNIQERSFSDLNFLSKTPKGLLFSKNQAGIMRSYSAARQRNLLKAGQLTGNRKLLCILIGFTDKSFIKTKADFEALFNQVGYATDGATGSVADYYKENSYNQFNLSVTVAGPYVASHNLAYYGANVSGGYDANPEALVTEAVNLAAPSINFSDFDNDKDGNVDGIYVLHAGFGEDSGAASNTIWAHTSNIPTIKLNGVAISDYACSSELRGASGTGITRIGAICHEFGHILGAMDFYDTNYTTNGSYSGTGNWDIMGEGSWNNNGTTPAHHNPYNKIYVYGWANAKTFVSGSNVTLTDAETTNTSFYRFNTTTPNEFFLCENRQKQKFDAYIPGHGMIIYHVDGNFISTADNEINIGSHQGLYPVCANATGVPPTTYGTINNAGLPFPGTANKSSFTDTTIPNALSWASAYTLNPITAITEDNLTKTIHFTAPTLPDLPATPSAYPATIIVQTAFNANWIPTPLAAGYKLDIATNPTFTNFVSGYNNKDVGDVTTFRPTGLNARTQYYYRIRAYNAGGVTENSNVISLTTLSIQPSAPSKTFVVSCNNLVTLRWRKNSDPYFRRYRIYGGLTSNPTQQIDSTLAGNSDTVKVIAGLTHSATYYFRVTAVNDDGPESSFGTQVSARVKTGIIPVISSKWGDVLICSNLGDSITSYQWYKGSSLLQNANRQFYATNKLPGAYFVETVDYDGCVNSSNILSALGLKSLSLYPNPASGSFTLKMIDPAEGVATVTILHQSGAKVMEFQTGNLQEGWLKEISTLYLENGIYLVRVVRNGQELAVSKILIIK